MHDHHALLVYAQDLETAPIPQEFKKQSADVLHYLHERLSIDHVRELIHISLQAPVEAPRRTFVIQAREIAVEGQHALLKLLEEPPQKAQFYVVLPPTAMVLPTLRSRLMEIGSETVQHEENHFFTEFLNASQAQRLALIAQMTKEKDHLWIDSILHGAEARCAQDIRSNRVLLSSVLFVRSHIGSRGASAKMLLEEISLHL